MEANAQSPFEYKGPPVLRVSVRRKDGLVFEAVNEGGTGESLMELYPWEAFESGVVASPYGDYWLVLER